MVQHVSRDLMLLAALALLLLLLPAESSAEPEARGGRRGAGGEGVRLVNRTEGANRIGKICE